MNKYLFCFIIGLIIFQTAYQELYNESKFLVINNYAESPYLQYITRGFYNGIHPEHQKGYVEIIFPYSSYNKIQKMNFTNEIW